MLPDLTVNHHPDEGKDRATFNLPTLEREASRDPHDHRMAFYYARELWYQGHWVGCRVQMMRYLGLPGGWGPERAEAWRILAAIDDHPERWLWKAVGEAPERREPWVDLARLYAEQGAWGHAKAMVRMAEERRDETIYTTQADCWGQAFADLRDLVNEAALGAEVARK